MSLTSLLVITDTHVPYLDRPSWRALKHYIEWRQSRKSRTRSIDKVFHLGDLADWDSLNQHNSGQPRLLEGKRLKDDFDAANDFLDEVQNLIPDYTQVEGNHEHWVQRFIDRNPAVEGLLSVESGLKFSTRGVKYVRYWTNKARVLQFGKAGFGHGFKSAKHHASLHGLHHLQNFFYGHVHANQRHATARIGKQKHFIAESIHCLCDVDRDWTMGDPNAWTNGFAIFNFDKNGYFWHNTVQIQKGRFVSPEGEMFTPAGRVTL